MSFESIGSIPFECVDVSQDSTQLQTFFDLVNKAYLVELGDTGVAFKKNNRFRSVEQARDLICDKQKKKKVLFFRSDGNLVGCACLVPLENNVVDLGPFAVDPAFQGKGFGLKILNFVKAHVADKMNAKTLEIMVVNHRTDVLPFYKRFGFVPTGQLFPFPSVDEVCTRECHFIQMHLDLTVQPSA